MPRPTVKDALDRFAATDFGQRRPRLLANLRTALRRALAHVYDLDPATLRRDLDQALANLALDDFIAQLPALQATFDANTFEATFGTAASAGTLQNYRYVLTRFVDWLPTPMAPSPHPAPPPAVAPSVNVGQTLNQARQTTPSATTPYALAPAALPPAWQHTLQALETFWVQPDHPARPEPPLRPRTWQAYAHQLCCLLGWWAQSDPHLDQLTLAQFTAPDTLDAFLEWGQTTRGNRAGWALNVTQAVLAVAKWQVATQPQTPDHTAALQTRLKALRHHYQTHQTAPAPTEPAEPALSATEIQAILSYLRDCCAPRHASGAQRSANAIAKSWQRYLITQLMVQCGLRPVEIQPLTWDQFIVDDRNQYWLQVPHRSRPHPIPIPPALAQDLTQWLTTYRSQIPTTTPHLFVKLGSGRSTATRGQPLNRQDITGIVSTAIFKASAAVLDQPRRVSAHTLRQNWLTWRATHRSSHPRPLGYLAPHEQHRYAPVAVQRGLLAAFPPAPTVPDPSRG